MLSGLWQWLGRLWRRPVPEPMPTSPEVSLLLDEGQKELREWVATRLRNDIIASLNIAQNYPPPQQGQSDRT